jgi:hypothetical protein
MSNGVGGFWLLDNSLVRIETYSAELNLRQPQEIELYNNIFEQLAAVASYGGAARAIIAVHVMIPALSSRAMRTCVRPLQT